MKTIRIATRRSPLAMWQAHFVKNQLELVHHQLNVELVPMVTKGDKILDTPLAKIGGKGLFVKELEVAMLENRADIAVHSMKDVPAEFPPGLELHTICEREDPTDAFVSNDFQQLDELPHGAIVGTASLRRQSQLLAMRPDLLIKSLRGNVGTRLSKLDNGEYQAIILATAGLKRLGLGNRITHTLSTDIMLPAAGQGAVGIECRTDDDKTKSVLAPLQHQETAHRVMAERAVNHKLEGGCQVPIGAHSFIRGDRLFLSALVGEINGSNIITSDIEGRVNDALALGSQLGDELLKKGAGKIIRSLYESQQN